MRFLILFVIFSSSVISQTITNFALLDLEGKNFVLHQELRSLSKNEFLVLNFMSSSCIPCKEEVPELLKLSKENPHFKLVFIFMGDKDSGALQFIEKYQMHKAYKILFDRLEISFHKLNFRGLPTTFVVNSDGTIYKTLVGYNQKNLFVLKNLNTKP